MGSFAERLHDLEPSVGDRSKESIEMVTITIDAVSVLAVGGGDITITGIDPADSHPLDGSAEWMGRPRRGRWALTGEARGPAFLSPMDMSGEEAAGLVAAARRLGAS